MSNGNGETQELDVVQHPTLGTLKFPKSMPFDERNRIIGEQEQKVARSSASSPHPWADQLQGILKTAEESNPFSGFSAGAARGALSTTLGTVHRAGQAARDWLGTKGFGFGDMIPNTSGAPEQEPELFKPTTSASKVGKGTEQVAEFLIPGGAEERLGVKAAELMPKLGRAAPVLGRLGTGALSTGAVNTAQGGSFGEGALLGLGAGAAGEAGRAIAPALAESALGVTKRMRGFGKTPGKAALEEVRGVSPGTIGENARTALSTINSKLESVASLSTVPTSTQSAVAIVDQEIAKAARRNSKAVYDQLQEVREQLTKDLLTGQPLPQQMPASQLLELKRGIGDLDTWNPEVHGDVRNVVRRVYSALNREFDRAVPAGRELNQRLSSLIPVAQRAESVERGAGFTQRVAHRLGVHTGALAGSAAGSFLGYEQGGPRGAALGATAGLVLPELLGSPTGQMAAARLLRSGAMPQVGRGMGAQLLKRRATPFDLQTE